MVTTIKDNFMLCEFFLLCNEYVNGLERYAVPPISPKTVAQATEPTFDAIVHNEPELPTVARLDGYADGYWSEYAEGVMNMVIDNRIAMGQLPSNIRDIYGDRFIAVYWYEDAFREYYATFPDGSTEVVYAIDWHNANLAHVDEPFFIKNKIIGEAGWSLARRHGLGYENGRYGELTLLREVCYAECSAR